MTSSRWFLLAFAAALALLPQLPVPEFWVTQLNYIGLYALVVIGLVLLTGIAGLTSFGQAAFVGIGAYSSAWLTLNLGLSPWLAVFGGLALTALAALLLGWITLRMSGHYLPLATIAWCLSLYYLFGNLEALGRYDGLLGIAPLSVFGLPLNTGRSFFYLLWALVMLAALAANFLLWRTTLGFRWRIAGASPSAARYVAISPARTVFGIMGTAGALAGLAGAIECLGVHYRLIEGFSAGFGFNAVAVALMGGLHPLYVIPAALFFGFLETGALAMQRQVGVPSSLVLVIQGLTMVFVLASLGRAGGEKV